MKQACIRMHYGILLLLVFLSAFQAIGQKERLRIQGFTIWAGKDVLTTPEDTSRGIFFNGRATIDGRIGSYQYIRAASNFTLDGSIEAANQVQLTNFNYLRMASVRKRYNVANDTLFRTGVQTTVDGSLYVDGNAYIDVSSFSSSVTGSVLVPLPVNYSGPAPAGGVGTYSDNLKYLPIMPVKNTFTAVSGNLPDASQTLMPGAYGTMALTGNRVVRLGAPGVYIFSAINNTGRNKIEFDFSADPTGQFYIFVAGSAAMGQINSEILIGAGATPKQIFMEVHGTSFSLVGAPAFTPALYGSNWLGTVWVPDGDIHVGGVTAPGYAQTSIIGAMWAGGRITVEHDVAFTQQAPNAELNFILPYYPPPAGGKVDAANNKIGSELAALYYYTAAIDTITDNQVFRINNHLVAVEIVVQPGTYDAVHHDLTQEGLIDTLSNGPGSNIITGYFPINKLTLLNLHPNINYARPLIPPITNAGQVTSQGDITMRSNLVKQGFDFSGHEVKVGVISDSYNNKGFAAADINNQDLPNDVDVRLDFPAGTGTDEGRAMLQIVHDVAPTAKLAFRTGIMSPGDMALGILNLAEPKVANNLTVPNAGACNIIVDDITWPTEPFFRDGHIARAVDAVTGQGITYFSAAGNFGNRSYEADFNASTSSDPAYSLPVHSFGGEPYQTIKLQPGRYLIVLQWDDNFFSLRNNNGVQNDLDIYLLGFGGQRLFGFNRSNISGDPIEILPFIATEETYVRLMVTRASGNGSPRFKYIVFRGEAEIENNYSVGSTIIGQTNAAGALAVGAILYDNLPSIVAIPNTVASFSSRGGTQVREDNGAFSNRQKPEIVAPNGVNTSVNLGGRDIEEDNVPNFFGTSAAAPHAAGVAALVALGKKKFTGSVATPQEIRQILMSSATDLHEPGYDPHSGYGLINADAAMRSFANPRPTLSSLRATDPGNPGVELPIPTNMSNGFALLARGENLSANTVIKLDGVVLPTHYISNNAVWAQVPIVNGNPWVELYTAPRTASSLDGGASEKLQLFGERKPVIAIKADNKQRRFGESNPTFTATVTIDDVVIIDNGMVVPNTGYDHTQLALDRLSFTTEATPTSAVYLYPINPVLTLDSVADAALLAAYDYQLIPGNLNVARMPVKITPKNKTVAYGQDIGVVEFEYTFQSTAVANAAQLTDSVSHWHRQYVADNVIAVVNDFHGAGLSYSQLLNMSTMASFQSVRNARRFNVFDGRMTPLNRVLQDEEAGLQRLVVDISAQSFSNYFTDPNTAPLVESYPGQHARALLKAKTLAAGDAQVEMNGQMRAMVNGQMMAMVNGQMRALVNGQMRAMVNGELQDVSSFYLQNGQMRAMVNGQEIILQNGDLVAVINGVSTVIDFDNDLVEVNGQMRAMVNGQMMAMVNGQMMAMVNGQMMAMVNGQMMAMVNGQMRAMVNGQMMAMVNGVWTAVDRAVLNADNVVLVEVDNEWYPVTNGQMMAMVNGQMMAMVNGQMMAMVNNNGVDELQFVQEITIASDGTVMATINGQMRAMVNGQMRAMVNGLIVAVTNIVLVNGQMRAMVNTEEVGLVNGQMRALVNGQMRALVNGNTLGGANSNTNTAVIVDQDDLNLQDGALGATVAINTITGLEVGNHRLIPAAFSHDNFDVTYGLGEVTITPATVKVVADNKTRLYGDPNPPFTTTVSGLAYGETNAVLAMPVATTTANATSLPGNYAINLHGGGAANYQLELVPGVLTIEKAPVTITADLKFINQHSPLPVFTATISGLKNGETIAPIQYSVAGMPTNVAGEFNNMPSVNAAAYPQYSFTFVAGKFYINPFGNGARKIVTKRECVRQLIPAVRGYGYMALFTYTNSNSTPVYVPRGEDNFISIATGGSVDQSSLPQVFQPGTHEVVVLFSGHQMQWQVRSIETFHKTAVTSEANQTSARCEAIVVGRPSPNQPVKEVSITSAGIYPNPASDMVTVQIPAEWSAATQLVVIDAAGKMQAVPQQRMSDGLYRLRISHLARGTYFVRVQTAEGFRTLRFIKQ